MAAGLYELAQYAFLADRNGGSGLTWSKLHDDNNGMITIWIILAVEWAVFLVEAWYLDQARPSKLCSVCICICAVASNYHEVFHVARGPEVCLCSCVSRCQLGADLMTGSSS